MQREKRSWLMFSLWVFWVTMYLDLRFGKVQFYDILAITLPWTLIIAWGRLKALVLYLAMREYLRDQAEETETPEEPPVRSEKQSWLDF